MKAREVRILGSGGNWISLCGKIALGLTGYSGKLPAGSAVSVVAADPGEMCLLGPKWVAAGKADMAITTPDWFVKLAVEGAPPFEEPLPLRMLATFPHDDRMAFAVRRETGIESFHDIRERRYPLRLSIISRNTWHPALWGAESVLAEYGITLDDIVSWGGELLSDRPRFINAPDQKLANERFEAVFDEALSTRRWKMLTDTYDMRFLPVDRDVLDRLAARGWRAGVIRAGQFRGVEEDVPTPDFSGWALVCRADMEEDLAYLTIAAIDEQKHEIEALFPQPFSPLTGPVDLTASAQTTPVPLHPGAERYYREHGYL